MSEGEIQPRRLRPTAFKIGLLSGFAMFLVICGLYYVWIVRPYPEPRYNVEVVSKGADVSRAGGRQLVIANNSAGALLTTTCQDACDDLWHRAKHIGDEDIAYGVQVLDAAGRCVVCGGSWYAQGVFGARWIARWTLAGDLKSWGEPRYFTLRPDGSLEPLDDEPAPSGSSEATEARAAPTY